jgi:hypothetical protein
LAYTDERALLPFRQRGGKTIAEIKLSAMALALAEPLEDLASPAGQIFINGHHIGIEQQQQLLQGTQHPAAVDHHQQLLQGLGGDPLQGCLFQQAVNLLPTRLALRRNRRCRFSSRSWDSLAISVPPGPVIWLSWQINATTWGLLM